MKLVDILARELKVWPERSDFAWQDYDLEIRFSHTTRNDTYVSTLADDHVRPRHGDNPDYGVTRAEWQAAVDALNAPKGKDKLHPHQRAAVEAARGDFAGDNVRLADLIECGYLVSPSLHHQWVGRTYRFEAKPEWSEDGLPNVGTKCVIYKGSYDLHAGAEEFIGPVVTVTARFKSARGIEMACVDSGGDGGCHIFRADMCFHLPTAEEIAAEEREKVIEDMIGVTGDGITCMDRYDAEQLYKAGYRKQVTK